MSETAKGRVTAFKPLEPNERLLYSLSGLTEGTLEIRYRVSGQIHVTEKADLAKVELPRRWTDGDKPVASDEQELRGFVQEQKRGSQGIRPQQRDSIQEENNLRPPAPERVQGERVMELLTLQPDTVRKFHRLAADGIRIEIEILHDGAVRETVSLPDLMRRGAELAARPILPVFAPSTVTGAGVAPPKRTARIRTEEYLPDCGDCTENHPCDTECG